MKSFGAGMALSGLCGISFSQPDGTGRKPNIIFILGDDLGYGELGCYGQKKIKTPNMDKLCAEGMKFTQAYCGSPVCAPSRCVFLSGMHSGHACVRDNSEVGDWESFQGQFPMAEGTETIAKVLKRQGYATACIGKWGLGAVGSSGDPNRQGFDLFFGYNCQRHAHNYYPKYLLRNSEKITLEGNTHGQTGKHYAPDMMAEEALKFMRENREKPFFLYFATPIPHMALQVPEDSLKEYEGKFEETPYDGKRGYQPHPKPRSAYAGMISRLDKDVGRMMALLDELGLSENTLVILTSDNGPSIQDGGTDPLFFESAGPLSNFKTSLNEGGIRVPFIARWKGRIKPGTANNMITALWDMMPTFAGVAGAPVPQKTDGISILPALLDGSGQKQHDYLYWERPSTENGSQAVRAGDWKAIRSGLKKNPDAPLRLYNLKKDIGEKNDVAGQNPGIAEKMLEIMREARTESADFPLFAK